MIFSYTLQLMSLLLSSCCLTPLRSHREACRRVQTCSTRRPVRGPGRPGSIQRASLNLRRRWNSRLDHVRCIPNCGFPNGVMRVEQEEAPAIARQWPTGDARMSNLLFSRGTRIVGSGFSGAFWYFQGVDTSPYGEKGGLLTRGEEDNQESGVNPEQRATRSCGNLGEREAGAVWKGKGTGRAIGFCHWSRSTKRRHSSASAHLPITQGYTLAHRQNSLLSVLPLPRAEWLVKRPAPLQQLARQHSSRSSPRLPRSLSRRLRLSHRPSHLPRIARVRSRRRPR